MDIREDETVETPSPTRGNPSSLLRVAGLVAALAALLGAAAVALSPSLRRRFVAPRAPLVSISIDSTPSGAEVFIDEDSRGTTPLQAPLAPGAHRVRLVLAGHEAWRRAVDPARTRKLAATLQPLQAGALIVESDPAGATVLLDGERRGTTRIRLTHVEPGAHVLRVAHEPRYRAVTRHVELQPRETRRLTVRLASNVEAFYRGHISLRPAKLANYTELLNHYLDEGRKEAAAATATKALQRLDAAEATAIELRQFHAQLDRVCFGRATGIGEAARDQLLDAVLALFARLAASQPHRPDHYLPLVTILERTGRFANVLEACDEAARRARAPGVVHVHIADACLARDQLQPAIALLERAIRLRPDDFQARCRLGAAYHRAERHDHALRQYQAAEKLADDAPLERRRRLQIDIARLLAAKGDLPGASARYDKAVGVPGGRAIEPGRGLVAHYRFDQNASDASGKGHHGENHGATLVSGGKLGGAFSFDGEDDYVSIPARATGGLTAATFALWVKTTQSKAVSRGQFYANPTLLGAATDGWGSGDLGLMLENGKAAYFHGLTPDGKDMMWFSANQVADGKWHHVALVHAGPLILFYVDGRLARGEASSAGRRSERPGVLSDTPAGAKLCKAALLIGASNRSFGGSRPASFVRGLIDDVRIWNRALTAREIAAVRATVR